MPILSPTRVVHPLRLRDQRSSNLCLTNEALHLVLMKPSEVQAASRLSCPGFKLRSRRPEEGETRKTIGLPVPNVGIQTRECDLLMPSHVLWAMMGLHRRATLFPANHYWLKKETLQLCTRRLEITLNKRR